MAQVQYFAVQPFVKTTKGRIAAAPVRSCHSPEAAKRLAERLVGENRAVGALAYARDGNNGDNDFDTPTFLARIGEVPEADDY